METRQHDMNHHTMVASEYSVKELFKFGLVLSGITIASLLLQKAFSPSGWVGWMRWFMGAFFLVFASFKFIGYQMFAEMFSGYDVIAKRFKPYAFAYPFIELTLSLAYLSGQFAPARDWTTLAIMAVSSIGVAGEIRKRSGIHCACLGNVIKLPLSTVSLVEDVGMGLMAILMVIYR